VLVRSESEIVEIKQKRNMSQFNLPKNFLIISMKIAGAKMDNKFIWSNNKVVGQIVRMIKIEIEM
jgi:hypothetical protein